MPETGPTQGINPGLQMISFTVEYDDDRRFEKWVKVTVPKNRTIQQIAARNANPEDAWRIAKKNKVRSVNRILWKPLTRKQRRAHKKRKQVRKLWVPGNFRQGNAFHVVAGDTAPKIVSGYAKFDVVDRPERAGLMQFQGYDPIEMEIPVRFEVKGNGNPAELEDDIKLLERMAGRGRFEGAAVGPPPIIGISVTGGADQHMIPLIPRNYQRTRQSPKAPLWRVVDIDWDDGALRNKYGNRYRQLAVITVRQHVEVKLAVRSVTKRARTRRK
jgi:hypothetical protein